MTSMLPPQALTDILEEAHIPVATLNMQPGLPNPLAIVRLGRLLKEWNPDVLHAHMVHANLLGRVTRVLTRQHIPAMISTAHNVIEGGRWVDLAYRFTDRFTDLTTNVSQRAVDRYVKVKAAPAHRIRRMQNGIETERFKPDPEVRKRMRDQLNLDDAFIWLAVGRFEEAKDYPNMVSAFSKIAKAHPEAHLLIVGQGTFEKEIKSLVQRVGLSEVVHFLGRREDIPHLMNASDAYLMSSAWEGLPMVLLEAASSGLPAVATDVGGNGEIVLHEHTGFLVPPKDATALAGAMAQLMELPAHRFDELRYAARTHVQAHFSLEHTIETWEGIYLSLLKNRNGNH